MHITVSKRNCFGAALAVGLGLVAAHIIGTFVFAGVTYLVQAML